MGWEGGGREGKWEGDGRGESCRVEREGKWEGGGRVSGKGG